MHAPVPWARSPARHLVTAKNGVNSPMLTQINAALDHVIKTGIAEQAWKKSMGDIPYKP
jgi:RNA-binding protein YhbY